MKSVFKKLSPINDADISGYEDALDFVFSDEDIKNIAVSGAYSSGKSSIVRTYETKHKDRRKLLYISLAHFCSKMNNCGDLDNPKCKEETIESKILNQLLQQISHSNIPLTRFKVKEVDEERPIIAISLLLSLLIFSVIYMIWFNSWCNWVFSINQVFFRNILLFSTEPSFRIVIAFIVLCITATFIYLIVHTQALNRLIRKICFKDYEIEIGQENDDSFFDKYMDEIIYIFENADVDGIVFEDLDRFDDLTVFERIREINTLANIRLKRDKNKIIRFFYLLRDDIFIDSKDRTKFFDFAIPVIPVVDGSNSYNLMIEYLKEAELYDHYDDNFIRLLSLYIDDLRITKNIINELIVFLNNLEGIDLDYNKMLAIIAYKNIFPKDYSDLQLNKGYVHAVFEAKNIVKKEIRKDLDEEATSILSEIKEINNELLDSLLELEDVKYSRYASRHYKEDYNTWLKTSYPKRKAVIEARGRGRVKELEEKLSTIKSKISLLDEYSLSELITDFPELNLFDRAASEKDNCYVDIISNSYFDLLKFLLSDGYIDETYSDYMTYFYPNSISRIDKIFLRSVTDRRAKDFGYRLHNPMIVIRYLSTKDFTHRETLNFDLYDLVFSGGYQHHVDNAISLLMTGEHNDFIDFYILYSEKAAKFVLSVIEKWPEFFEYSISELKDDTVEKICYILINYCDEEMLKRINTVDISTNEGVLTGYISSRPNFLSKEYNHDAECRALSLLNVSFKEIIYDSAIDELFDYVYQNDLYEINYSNICLMLKEKCGIKDVQQQLRTFFSFIRNNMELQFCHYINENLFAAISAYLDAFDGDIEDDQESAVVLINEVDFELAEKYIARLKTEIESAKSINYFSLRPVLLKQNKISYTADNILLCFKDRNEMYPELVDFINSNPMNIDYKSCVEAEDDTSVMEFLSKVLVSDDIEDNKYIQIVENITNCEIELKENPEVPEGKMKLLIERKCLVASAKNLICIRNNYPKLIPELIALYIKEYMELSPSLWTNEEILIILSLTNITDSDKIAILKGYNGTISIVDQAFSSEITETILEFNFDEQDLEWLCQNYSSLPNRNQALILIIKRIRKIIDSNYYCCFDLITDILESTAVGFDNKMEVFEKSLDGIKKEELYALLFAFGFDSILQSLKGKNVKVIVNSENTRILELLTNRNIIQPCTITPSGKYYQRIRFSGMFVLLS